MEGVIEKSSAKCFGGELKVFTHSSNETGTPMTFAVFLPEKSKAEKCPVVYWLSGLTCTEQNFITKAGAQRVAGELGLILVCPDTSPRGCNIEGENDAYDFGVGAGFYVDATRSKWKANYRMYSYVTKELPRLVHEHFPVKAEDSAIFGHSMGGHGALICALKNPGTYKSVSAFAPICNPMKCPWGQKAFSGYLGENQSDWKSYDATELASAYGGPPLEILIDQGSADGFLKDGQLLPDNFVAACSGNPNLSCNFRMQEGYDHGYYFISTFIEDHLKFLAKSFGC